jgi:hypothetical protein
MVIVSPYAIPGHTDSTQASYASMISFVEHNFGLPSLWITDKNAYDYSGSFNYAQKPLAPIQLREHPVPAWEQRWIAAHPSDPNDGT